MGARCRAQRHDPECESQDPGQGGHSAGAAEAHLCRQAARGWAHSVGLQHPKGVDLAPGAETARRKLSETRTSCPALFCLIVNVFFFCFEVCLWSKLNCCGVPTYGPF